MEWRSRVSFLAKTVDIHAGLFLDVNGVAVNKKTKLFEQQASCIFGGRFKYMSLIRLLKTFFFVDSSEKTTVADLYIPFSTSHGLEHTVQVFGNRFRHNVGFIHLLDFAKALVANV